MKRLRWKKEKAPTGLSAVGAGPRGFIYHDGEKQYASVSALGGGYQGPLQGWYWVAGWDSDVPHKNTCDSPKDSPNAAKQEATEYVKAFLENRKDIP